MTALALEQPDVTQLVSACVDLLKAAVALLTGNASRTPARKASGPAAGTKEPSKWARARARRRAEKAGEEPPEWAKKRVAAGSALPAATATATSPSLSQKEEREVFPQEQQLLPLEGERTARVVRLRSARVAVAAPLPATGSALPAATRDRDQLVAALAAAGVRYDFGGPADWKALADLREKAHGDITEAARRAAVALQPDFLPWKGAQPITTLGGVVAHWRALDLPQEAAPPPCSLCGEPGIYEVWGGSRRCPAHSAEAGR